MRRKAYNKKGNFKYKKGNTGRNTSVGSVNNDPSWWMLDTELGKLATAVNMLTPNGLDHDFADGVNLALSNRAIPREPGVAANIIATLPAGISRSQLSPLNEACRAMFTWIRSKLMKNITRYEKSDLMKMCIATANILAAVEFFNTSLRVIKKYNVLNRYTPSALLRAMCIDPTDIVEYSIEMERYLGILKHRLENLIVPKIPFFSEIIESFKHIYVDEDIAKAQIIVNVPAYFLKFTIDADTGKGKLVPVPYALSSGVPYSVNDIKELIEDLLSELMNDEDYAFMSGDILAAYPDCYTLDSVITLEPIEFEYSKEFLEKWHNSCQFGFNPLSSAVSGWEITEETDSNLDPWLKFDPIFTSNSDANFELAKRGVGNRYLDFYDREVTPDQIMTATRWMFSLEVYDESLRQTRFFTVSTQVVMQIVLYYYDKDGTLTYTVYDGSYGFKSTSEGLIVSLQKAYAEILIRKWNYSPLSIVLINDIGTGSTSTKGYVAVSGDLGNYTVVDKRVLKSMNELANYTVIGTKPLLEGK